MTKQRPKLTMKRLMVQVVLVCVVLGGVRAVEKARRDRRIDDAIAFCVMMEAEGRRQAREMPAHSDDYLASAAYFARKKRAFERAREDFWAKVPMFDAVSPSDATLPQELAPHPPEARGTTP